MSDLDAIIVGAGHNGLTCAAYLGIKKRRKQLLEQIKPLESGTGRIYNGKTDVTKVVLGDVRRQLAQREDLLTHHPAGVKPGLD
jgi:thioredoxin reductase